MNDPVNHRQVPRKQDRDNEHLFWYWLPVVGAAGGPYLDFRIGGTSGPSFGLLYFLGWP